MELTVTPSSTLIVGFSVISLLMVCWWVWAVGRVYVARSGVSKDMAFHYKAAAITAAFLVAWLAFTAFVGSQDWAHTFDTFPPPGLRVFIVLIGITIFLAYARPGKMLTQHLPLFLLVGFQAFRIPVEFLIHQAYVENVTIVEMTYLGRNFDILTGLTALVLAIYIYKGQVSSKLIFIWNLFGLGLLINVVATGILSMPHKFQLIQSEIPNIWITFFPFIWLPAVLVCSALFGHLLVFRYLALNKSKDKQMLASPSKA